MVYLLAVMLELLQLLDGYLNALCVALVNVRLVSRELNARVVDRLTKVLGKAAWNGQQIDSLLGTFSSATSASCPLTESRPSSR